MAHEQPRIATCENGMRLGGMGDQRLDAAIERKRGAMPYPRLSRIRTVPDAPADRSKTYAVVCCHTLPSFVSVPLCHPRAGKHLALPSLFERTMLFSLSPRISRLWPRKVTRCMKPSLLS